METSPNSSSHSFVDTMPTQAGLQWGSLPVHRGFIARTGGFAPTDVLTQLPPLLGVLQQDTERRSLWHGDVELDKSLLLLRQFSIGCRYVKQMDGDGLRGKSGHCLATQTPVAVGTRGPGSHIHVHVAPITSAAAFSHPTTPCNDQDITDGEREEVSH